METFRSFASRLASNNGNGPDIPLKLKVLTSRSHANSNNTSLSVTPRSHSATSTFGLAEHPDSPSSNSVGHLQSCLAPRTDSMLNALRTVSEIDAILGTEYKPPAEESEADGAIMNQDDLEELSSQLNIALTRQLTFKNRLRSSLRLSRCSSSIRRRDDYSSLKNPVSSLEIANLQLETTTSATDVAMSRQLQDNKYPGSSDSSKSPTSNDATHSLTHSPFANSSTNKDVALQMPKTFSVLTGSKPQIEVGSDLEEGEWDSQGQWLSKGGPQEVFVPPQLQQIKADDLVKIRELGRGCFGTVWLAKWLGVEVAVKEMLEMNPKDCNPEQVFSEAERLASLRHPCVIVSYGIVTSPDSYATVIEYMRHGSLRGALQRMRKQALSRGDLAFFDNKRFKAAVAVQAARGMEYLHSQFVVHFDLKCDNLLCDLRDMLRPVVKIGDLGLSKKKKETFISGNMRGTLPWMAPELFPSVRDAQHVAHSASDDEEYQEDKVNEKVDVFSFGVVLWEIWTLGDTPYPNMHLSEIFAGIMSGHLRPDLPEDCDEDWGQLMQDCWQAEPRSRPCFSEIASRLDVMVDTWSSTPVSEGASRAASFR